jgi:MFS family permease
LPPTSAAEAAGPRRAFAALCIVAFLNSFFVSPFSALFPVYIEADLGRLPLFTANLRALMLVLGGVFAVVAGRLCDTLGRKNTLLIGLAGSALTGLVFRTSEPALLALLVLVMGAASGPWSTAGQSYLIAAVTPRRLGIGGALYFLSNTAGNSLGSLVTGRLKEDWAFGEIGTGMGVALGMLFVVAIFVLPAGDKAPAAVGPRSNMWSAYLPLLKRRDVHLLIGLRAMVTTFWGMATLLMPLLVYRAGQSAPMAAYFASVSLAVAAAGQLTVGYLSDRLGLFWPLLVSGGGVVLGAVALALYSDSLTGLFVAGTALTAAAWAVSTLIPKLINEVAGPEEKNRLVGLGHFVWSAAMVSGSILGGILVEADPALPFYCGAVLAAGGTACGWRLCVRLDRGAVR